MTPRSCVLIVRTLFHKQTVSVCRFVASERVLPTPAGADPTCLLVFRALAWPRARWIKPDQTSHSDGLCANRCCHL